MKSGSLKNLTKFIASLTLLSLCSGANPLISPVPSEAARVSPLSNKSQVAIFNQLDLYANIETVGIVANGANLPKTAELMYRQAGESTWHSGHPLVRNR